MGWPAQAPPDLRDAPIKQAAGSGDDSHADDTPFAKRIEIIIVRILRAGLHPPGSHRGKFDVEMARPNAKGDVALEELPGSRPVEWTVICRFVGLERFVKSLLH